MESELDKLLNSKDVESIKTQLDSFQAVLSLASNPVLNDRSKRAIVLQASGEFDKISIMVSDYYGKLGEVALKLPNTPSARIADKLHLESKPESKKKRDSEDEEENSEIETPMTKTRGNRSVARR